jgi:hypothetical protein
MVWVIKVDFTGKSTGSVNIRSSITFCVENFYCRAIGSVPHLRDNRGFQPTEISAPPAKSAIGTTNILPAHRLIAICAEPKVLYFTVPVQRVETRCYSAHAEIWATPLR